MTTMDRHAGRRSDVAVELPAPRRDGSDLVGSLAALRPGHETPLHLQLRSVLDAAVDSSGLAHGERIWSESQLMRHYGVSRHVVRQALNQLVLEGRLSVRKGAGYFVNRRRVTKNLPAVTVPAEPADGGEPFAVELLDIGIGPTIDREEAALVPRRHRPRVHRVRRLGRIDGEPVALLAGAYPTALAKVLTAEAVSGAGAFATLAAHGLRPSHVDVELGVAFAAAAESLLLGVAEGAPLVCIRCRARTEAGDLVAVMRELYRSDRFEFAYSADVGSNGWTVRGR